VVVQEEVQAGGGVLFSMAATRLPEFMLRQ